MRAGPVLHLDDEATVPQSRDLCNGASSEAAFTGTVQGSLTCPDELVINKQSSSNEEQAFRAVQATIR